MLLNESNWIKNAFSSHFSETSFPLLNIGSSTKEFREKVQPHIDQNVFEPLKKRGVKVWHADIKLDSGVDLAGDVNDPEFQNKLRTLGIRSILCSNLLEHLIDPLTICKSMLDLLQPGNLLMVTVPHTFPYHKDPIDTMLRPDIPALHKMFPGTEIVTSAIVEEAGTYKRSLMADKRYLSLMIIRWLMPFYKFSDWKLMMRDLFTWNRKHSSTCILLRKL